MDLWDLLGELLGWFADVLAPLGAHLVHRQTGQALAQGRLGCSLKVMSGRQQGLSARWRRGAVVISAGRLDFTPEQGWPRAAQAHTHLVVLGPARPPSMEELTRLQTGWRITELQTPTATLGWAVPAHDLGWLLGSCKTRPPTGPVRCTRPEDQLALARGAVARKGAVLQIVTAGFDAPPITCVSAVSRTLSLRIRPTYIPRPSSSRTCESWHVD